MDKLSITENKSQMYDNACILAIIKIDKKIITKDE